jgi:hypothetical protein
MPSINVNKAIQRSRTEEEMRKALHNFCEGKQTMCVPAQIDDDDIILMDAITELIEKRGMIQEIKSFVQIWNTRLFKR